MAENLSKWTTRSKCFSEFAREREVWETITARNFKV